LVRVVPWMSPPMGVERSGVDRQGTVGGERVGRRGVERGVREREPFALSREARSGERVEPPCNAILSNPLTTNGF
jgi:hypothetical protein